MTTHRRAVLTAIAAAPVMGAASAAPSPVETDLASLDVDALLRYGATLNADSEFAALCTAALAARAGADAAEQLADGAEAAADAATPAYPSALCYSINVRGWPDLEVKHTEDRRWRPDDENGWTLWNLAHREARRRGVAYSRALEDELRQQYEAWRETREATNGAFHVAELNGASREAGREACRAFDAVIAYPTRSKSVLRVQLHLLRAEGLPPNTLEEWAALVAHVERALH